MFKAISHLVLVFIVNFEHVNADWQIYKTYTEESVLQAKRAAPDTFYPLM